MDMFLAMNEEQKEHEKKQKEFEVLLTEGKILFTDIPQEYRNLNIYLISFAHAKDVFEKRKIAKTMSLDIQSLAEAGRVEESEQLKNLKRAVFGTVTLQE